MNFAPNSMPRRPDPEDNEVGRRRPDPDSWARPPPIASIGPSRNHPSRFGSESDIPSPGPPGFHLPTSEIHSFEPANTRNSPVFHGNSDPATNSPFPLPNHIGQLVNNGVKSNRPAEDPAEYLLSPPMRFESTGEAFHRRLNSSVLVKLPPLHENEVPLNQTPTRAKPTTRPGNSQALGIAPLTNDRRGASTIQGYKTIRLSVIPYNAIQPDAQTGVNTTDFVKSFDENVSFTPKRLLDVENGVSILVTSQKFLSNHRFQELGDDGAVVVVTARTTAPIAKEDNLFFEERGQGLKEKIRSGDVRAFDAYSEIGSAGQAWRGILRRFMVAALDDVNGLRLGRQLELFIPFLTGYESYLIGQVIEALDQHPQKPEVDFILKIAFQNRNVSRILVQSARPRWDFFWHSYQAVSHNREFDAFGQIPLIGITSFPATENFPSTRNHVVASIARVVLGQGGWITRVLTGNRQGLNADHPERNIAQNLAPESNGSEAANRNQFGTYVGRIRTNQFRLHHRLPVDESIVRTFVGQPTSTMINNGVVHTFRQLAKHWHNMLDQPSGNFAHQRMEQLNPFETMRFHIPMVCVVLSNLRGRNRWDSAVLGPFMRNCQELTPTLGVTRCIEMVREMKENILLNVTAGIASVYDPLNSWLDAIIRSCEMIEEESKEVYQKVTSVEIGLRLGHDLMTQVTWKLPSEAELKESILLHIKGKPLHAPVNERRIRSALFLTTPRDKRTLIELVKLGHESTKPAQLLLGRVKTLLQREIRREALNEAIRGLSFGDYISSGNLVTEEWYWLEEGEKKAVYIYSGKIDGKETYRFVHVDSGYERFVSVSDGTMKYRVYVPVAESITRAQRCYMNIELEHGKKFSYSAFMEFPALRIALRRLAIISQIFCEELDNARINFLREVQRSNQTQVGIVDMEIGRTYYIYNNKEKSYEPFVCQKKYTPTDPEWQNLGRTKILTIPPQNMMVVGGGPTGLVTVIHCTESVLMGGGVMKLFEARDAFFAGGSTFERAQIVRLDARWIAMLRYHLGTGFEDIYIPASGETDAQLGNTLPTQGFVEITIKDLENMLHVEVSRMWSKGLIQCYTNSTAKYDHITNTLIKQGQHLKLDDGILRRFDPDGHPSSGYYSWKVVDLIYQKSLAVDDLKVGHEYGIFIRQENAVLPFKLTAIDLQSQTYTFTALKNGVDDVRGTMHTLPSVYPKGTRKHANVTKVVVECVQKGSTGGYTREELPMSGIETQKFTMDIGHTHVVECIG